MPEPAPPAPAGLTWRKSTFSSSNGGCVEIARHGDWTYMRDTKAGGAGPVLGFNPAEWAAFREGVRAGEFD